MRIALDATPLLGQRSGVGNYVHGLVAGLADLVADEQADLDVRLTLFSIRGSVHPALSEPLPPGIRTSPRRAPARLLRRGWSRWGWPPVEVLTGRVDAFHGTNFVVPPTARAAGLVTVHDLAYLRYPDTVTGDAAQYATLVPQALARGAHVLAVTRAMADEIADEYRLDPGRITVAHHGVDPAWTQARPPGPELATELGLPDRYVVFSGNLEPRKNLGMLVQAHRAARRADPSVPRLVLVGAAGWGDRWQGNPPRPEDVVLLGYLPATTLRAVVAGAEAVCMPSRYEGFGLPVLEGLAAGRPVLASDIPAHREVAGGTATLLPVDDLDAWAGALGALGTVETASPAERRAHAASFTWRASARAHVAAWRDAMRRAGSAGTAP